jgi:signal transduction histidine kinase
MQSTDLHQAEKLLQNLTHDLRQSLGTIGVSAYILNQSLPAADVHARAHIRTIERQVEAASNLLREAVAAMRRVSDQTGIESRELTKSATSGLT